ncbi:MAG: hypothetical protein HY871_06130 [Chloroflexi bacterium]|nr:hypothetical protein [Chloroflexota bacterium]
MIPTWHLDKVLSPCSQDAIRGGPRSARVRIVVNNSAGFGGYNSSIVLAAAFYSLHHAGFQPEFVKLFFVGLMYMTVFRTTRNLLIVYPFFWGVGACWDVLVQFGAAPERLRWSNALVVLVLMALTGVYFYRKAKRR